MDAATKEAILAMYDAWLAYQEERRVLKMWYKLKRGSPEERRAQRAKVRELEVLACRAYLHLEEVKQLNEGEHV